MGNPTEKLSLEWKAINMEVEITVRVKREANRNAQHIPLWRGYLNHEAELQGLIRYLRGEAQKQYHRIVSTRT